MPRIHVGGENAEEFGAMGAADLELGCQKCGALQSTLTP